MPRRRRPDFSVPSCEQAAIVASSLQPRVTFFFGTASFAVALPSFSFAVPLPIFRISHSAIWQVCNFQGRQKKRPLEWARACFFEATKHQNAHQHRPPTLQQHQHSCTKPAGGALSSTFLARARVRGLASRGGGGARFLSLTPPSRPAVPGASDETDPRRWRSRRWQGVVGEFLPEVREFITRHTAFFCFRVYSRINQHPPIPTD